MFWTLDRVAKALDQASSVSYPRGATELSGVTTDSRAVAPGQIFVALVGDKFDGHDYLEAAIAQGAAAVLISRPQRLGSLGVPVYEVDDTLVALGRLASYWRHAWGKTVIAVAGSNGKTTTKDIIRAALSGELEVHATTCNLNNRIGVPLTLLSIPASAQVAVVEVGTNLPGEVAILRDIAKPDVAVVASIGEEHLEGLGDLAGVLREEVSVYEGVAIGISPSAQPEIALAARGMATTFIEAGLDDGDLKPDRWSIDADGSGVVEFGGTMISPPLRGIHNLRNTMLAIAVARVCG
ncbi:MAG: UDP-N-acetylmuramoyl-tripeptide--D-alanyl-D-alanine ligase, partial [Gemmatimonadaceae bacterium]